MSEDYAWAAGFWDGEGCVSLTYRGPYKTPRMVVQIAQVHREVLDRFQNIIGFGNVLGPYEPKTKNSQPYYVWRVEGSRHLADIRSKLADYLGSVKLKQMDDALEARRVWEETATCNLGHRLSKSPGGGQWRCATCQAEQGRKNAISRWAKQKEKVM